MWRVMYNDLRLIFREPALWFFVFLPVLILILIGFLLPGLIEQYSMVEPYIPYVLMLALTQTSTMFGFIYAMVLIDEKDTQVAKVYGVLPIAPMVFLGMRLLFPVTVSVVYNLLLLFVQPFYTLAFLPSVFVALLASLLGPIMALGVGVLAKNKVEGMTWFKAFNLPVVIPVLAFFIPSVFAFGFGIIPTHWLFQATFGLIENGSIALPILIGLIYHGFLMFLLMRFFVQRHFS